MDEQIVETEAALSDADADNPASPASENQADSVRAGIRAYLANRFPLFVSYGMDDESSLLEGGAIDSLGILDVVSYLETEFAITIENEDVSPENFESVMSLARLVARKRPGT